MPQKDDSDFQFEISLSVLNHLGRNLYRNFITILGEAISNAWDADAENVFITIDRESNQLIVKDDGVGMDAEDFQKKFLRVGYSKRRNGDFLSSGKKRPFIGAKGIGKLALLSCAETVTVISRKAGDDYVGGRINNSDLDDAIKDEIIPGRYLLGDIDFRIFSDHLDGHKRGTIIHFETIKENIRNSVEQLRKLIALNFRFSLVDPSFRIFVNGEVISYQDLKSLSLNTQFLWCLNKFRDDPFVDSFTELRDETINLKSEMKFEGFLATVRLPRHIKVLGTEEKVTIDLFVNGRLREKDILKHIPRARLVENYIFGQIHFDELDQSGEEYTDRFTSGREGIVEGDDLYNAFLSEFSENILKQVIEQWDQRRIALREPGDPEGEAMSRIDRAATELMASTVDSFKHAKTEEEASESDGGGGGDEEGPKENPDDEDNPVDQWFDELGQMGDFYVSSYATCFLAENLLRRSIHHSGNDYSSLNSQIQDWERREKENLSNAHISYEIRMDNDPLAYTNLWDMTHIIEDISLKGDHSKASLYRDRVRYRPLRNVVGHTGLLTESARNELAIVFENIRARLKVLLGY